MFQSIGQACVSTVFLFLSLLTATVDADGASWNYDLHKLGGPDSWYQNYPDCGGVMQSPVNIETSDAVYSSILLPFDFSDYNLTSGVNLTLANKGGHTAEVLYHGKPILLKGGGLPADYKIVQFHFHWGSEDTNGSEHSIDNKYFPMEMHIVHQQVNITNVTIAQQHPFGLAVLGFFFQLSSENNTKFDKLLSHFDLIASVVPEKDNETDIETFPLLDLLPENIKQLEFYRYYGSLTTPACYETVIWSLATEYINISHYQLGIFRSLYNDNNTHLQNDYRPTQPLNKRIVITNKQPVSNTSPTALPTSQALKCPSAAPALGGQTVNIIFGALCILLYTFL